MRHIPHRHPRPGTAILLLAASLAAGCGGESPETPRAAIPQPPAAPVSRGEATPVTNAAIDHLRYRYRPMTMHPGQSPIVFEPITQKPSVPGYISAPAA